MRCCCGAGHSGLAVHWRNSCRLFGCSGCSPHPFSQRLRSASTPAVWLPKDSQTSCSDLQTLFERSALARREFVCTPALTPIAGCPDCPALRGGRGRWMQGRFFASLLAAQKGGRLPGRVPASSCQQRPLTPVRTRTSSSVAPDAPKQLLTNSNINQLAILIANNAFHN